MDIGYRNLCCRYKVEGAVLNPEELFLELRQLACRGHAGLVHHERRQDLQIAMLGGMQVEHEADQCALAPGPHAFIKSKAGSRDLGSPVKIDDVQILGQVPVGFRLEGKYRGFAALGRPPPDLYIAVFVFTIRHGTMRQVGSSKQDVSLRFFLFPAFVLKLGDGITDGAHLGNLVFRRLPRLLEPSDLLGDLVAPTAQLFNALLQGSAVRVQCQERSQIKFDAPSADSRQHLIRMFTNEL